MTSCTTRVPVLYPVLPCDRASGSRPGPRFDRVHGVLYLRLHAVLAHGKLETKLITGFVHGVRTFVWTPRARIFALTINALYAGPARRRG